MSTMRPLPSRKPSRLIQKDELNRPRHLPSVIALDSSNSSNSSTSTTSASTVEAGLDDVVAVNAGGTIIETLRRIWMQVEGSMLEAKFRGPFDDIKDSRTGLIFIPHRGRFVQAMVEGFEAIAVEPSLMGPNAPSHWYVPPTTAPINRERRTRDSPWGCFLDNDDEDDTIIINDSNNNSSNGKSHNSYNNHQNNTTAMTSSSSEGSWSHSDVVQFRYMLDYYGVTLGLYRIGVYQVQSSSPLPQPMNDVFNDHHHDRVMALIAMHADEYPIPPSPPVSIPSVSTVSFRQSLVGWCADTVNPVIVEVTTTDKDNEVYLFPLIDDLSPFGDRAIRQQQPWYVKSFEIRRMTTTTTTSPVVGRMEEDVVIDDDTKDNGNGNGNVNDKAILGWAVSQSKSISSSTRDQQPIYFHHETILNSKHTVQREVHMTIPVGTIVRIEDMGRTILVNGVVWVPPPSVSPPPTHDGHTVMMNQHQAQPQSTTTSNPKLTLPMGTYEIRIFEVAF